MARMDRMGSAGANEMRVIGTGALRASAVASATGIINQARPIRYGMVRM